MAPLMHNANGFGMVRGVLLIGLLLLPAAARAQRSEPPLPDADGNFTSSQTTGNRGPYELRHWLIVDADPKGTNCRRRDAAMEAIARLRYGDLVETDTPQAGGLQQAVEFHRNRPWLRIRLPGWRATAVERRGRGSIICLVRAHARFIAPVNGSDLIELMDER